jgi:hypothetical protein
MDLIERIFGFIPDNGSGLTELLLVLVPVVVLSVVVAGRYRRIS